VRCTVGGDVADDHGLTDNVLHIMVPVTAVPAR